MGNNKSLFLHHDIEPVYISHVLRDHFAKNSTYIVLQPPCFPVNCGDKISIEEGADGYSEKESFYIF